MEEAQYKPTFFGNKPPLKKTIFLSIGWLLFIIVYIILFASSYSVYVHMGMFLLSLLVILALIVVVWLIWIKTFIPMIGITFLKNLGIFKKIIITFIIPFMILLLLSIYFLFFADFFSFLQNMAMLFISFISIVIGVTIVWRKNPQDPFQFVKQTANSYKAYNSKDE